MRQLVNISLKWLEFLLNQTITLFNMHISAQLKKIVYSFTVAIFVVTVFGLFSLTAQAVEDPPKNTYYGLEDVAVKSGLIKANQGDVSLAVKIGQFIKPLMGLTGSVFLVLTIYAGVMWMTAAGNEERVAKAKKILGMASIGLLVVVMAYAITSFIGGVIFGNNPSSQKSTENTSQQN